MASSNIPKGSEAERRIWKQWAIQNHLANENGIFLNKAIDERRAAFRADLAKKDIQLLDAIEHVLINIFYFQNHMVERWPKKIRTMLNRVTTDPQAEIPPPFESWYDHPGLEKRKQATRVWTELATFLVLEYHIHNVSWVNGGALQLKGADGNFPDLGLSLSEDMCEDIMDLAIGQMHGLEYLESAVHALFLSIIMHKSTKRRRNPLLFWAGLIIQTEEFGDQPRFAYNGLKDNLNTREKLEAIVHYARVLILDHAYISWLTSNSVSEEWKRALENAINRGDLGWVDEGAPRPAAQQDDPSDIDDPFWQAFIEHFNNLSKKWLTKDSKSPISVILKLLDA